ncbi:MAG: hypothetical protein EXS05_06375 [Planctomycetaceae bacterium]|nr:hypothetical protein [Planctomycetaceae bacterium]
MLVEAGRVAIEQNRRVAAAFAERGVSVPPFSALPAAPPLCLLHIPKTGGASAIMWLESMFAEAEVAPCRNTVDFEILQGSTHRYRLFAGHILGRQRERFPGDAQWMTIFRDPVEMAVSAYHHRRLAPMNDWEADRAHLLQGDPLRGDDALDKARAAEMTELFREIDFISAIKQRLPSLRPFFRDTLARRLGATESEDASSVELDDDDPELQEMRRRQWQRATTFVDSIDLVGEYSALHEFLLLVAATRGWPSPPPLARIHDFGAPTRADSSESELRAQLAGYSPIDEKIYARGVVRSNTVGARLRELCGGVTAGDVDAHHRRRVFAETKPVYAFDVTADEAGNGCGWGLREHDNQRNPIRQFADGRSASTLVRLNPNVHEYRLFVHVRDAGSQAVLDGFSARASNTPLERADAAWRNGVLTFEWRVPASLVVATRGNVEFVFEKDESTRHDKLAIARIGCVPAVILTSRWKLWKRWNRGYP